MMWSIILGLVACASVAQCYTCPEENTSVFFVDVAENCTVYSYCNGSELKLFLCPDGKAFDVAIEECRNIFEVLCLENSLIRQKRHDLQIHSISIDNLKNSLKKMEKELMSIVETLIEEIAPSVLTEIQKKYIPFVSNVKEEIMPIVKQKLLPHIKTSISYAKRLGLRIADKIHQSIEMSNSTHINIVSFSDIMSDVSKDAQPLLKMGKFFSSKALRGARVKRQAYYSPNPASLPEAFVTYLDPFVAGFIPAARNMMITNEYTVKNKVILPIIFDMLQDPETRYDLIRIFFIAKDSFGPIALDMFFQQPFFAPRGSVVHLSTDQVLAAKLKFTFEAKPLIAKVALKYMPVIVRRCVDNAPLIMESIARLKQAALPYAPELMFRVKNFMEKHGSLLLTSSSTHINTYSLMEIKEDLKPIGRILLEIFIDKMSKEPNSFLSSFFNRNSVLYSVLTADERQMSTGKRVTDPRIPALRRAFAKLPQAQQALRRRL